MVIVHPNPMKSVIDALADIRSKARGGYFGYDEPGQVRYIPESEEVKLQERRVLGLLLVFQFRSSDGSQSSYVLKKPFSLWAKDLLICTRRYRSPGFPPALPGDPIPLSLIRWPLLTLGGILTIRFLGLPHFL